MAKSYYDPDDYPRDREMTLPFQQHSETSREAAEKAKPGAATMRGAVLQYLIDRGERGATDHEICEALQVDASSGRPRRIDLVNADLVYDSGETRETPSGRKATVWRAR